MKAILSRLNNYIIKEKTYIILLVGIASILPLFIPGVLRYHDMPIHLYRTVGYAQSILDGQIPPQIYYNVINSFGYAWGIFYPPLSAAIPAIFYIIGFSVTVSQTIFFALASIFAGLFMYGFLKSICKNKLIALITAIIYITAPYKIVDTAVRGAARRNIIIYIFTINFLGIT